MDTDCTRPSRELQHLISVVKAEIGRRVQQYSLWIAVRNALLNPVEAAMKLDQ
jgi:hypothetical protein